MRALHDQGSLAQRLKAASSATRTPDLLDDYIRQNSGPSPDQPWPEAGGHMFTDETGSSHIRPSDPVHGPEDIPSFTFQGEAIQPGHPPAVGGTEIPEPRGYDASAELNPLAIERLRRAALPTVEAATARGELPGLNDQMRTNNVVPGLMRNFPDGALDLDQLPESWKQFVVQPR